MPLDTTDEEVFKPIDPDALIADRRDVCGTLLNVETGEQYPGAKVRFRGDDGYSVWILGLYEPRKGHLYPQVFLDGTEFMRDSFEPAGKWHFKREP